MTFKDLKEIVAMTTSIADGDLLNQKINAAADEIWNSVDLPGCLQEDYFNLGESAVITLPYYVHRIRKVKPCEFGINTKLNGPIPAYSDHYYTNSPWNWRILRETPLMRDIEEASTLEIRPEIQLESDVLISFAGPTDVADRGQETVTLSAGESSVQTVNRYEDLDLLQKHSKTAANLHVYDAKGNEVAFIPNHILPAKNTQIQVYTRCDSNMLNRCLSVLYKPILPYMSEDLDVFPEPYGHALVVKVLEWFKIDVKEALEHASLYATKSSSMFARASGDFETGQAKPIQARRSPFQKSSGWSGL